MPDGIDQDLKMRVMHYIQNADQVALKSKKIYIWGSLEGARQTAETLSELGIGFAGFVDNDIKAKRKRIKGFYNKEVFYSQEILSKSELDSLFVLPTRRYTEIIMKQIISYGFSISQVLNPFKLDASICITNKCNLKCRFCVIYGENATDNYEYGEMSFEKAQTVIEILSAEASDLIISAAGDPLLHKDFISILSYAYKNFYTTTVVTNGLALNEKMADKIINIDFSENKRLLFSFSVTGVSTDVYNRFQGSGQTSDEAKNTVYKNINYLSSQRNIKGISEDRLIIRSTYILNAAEDNYEDLKEYCNHWKNKLDHIGITPERRHAPDFETHGYEFKIDENAEFLCAAIHGKVSCAQDVNVCCQVYNGNSKIGNMIDKNSWPLINTRHNQIIENFYKGKYPEFCRSCHFRNSYCFGFFSQTFRKVLSNISLIQDFFRDKEKVLFYGLNEYQRVLYTIIKGEGIIDRENIFIIDAEAEGYFHNKRILKPTIENLKGQDMIVFEENSFMELDVDIINSLNSWVSYQDFID